jgi:hypothetical protein
MKYLTWNDLTEAEKEQAKESYIGVREWEEERSRDDTTSNKDYDCPISTDILEDCRFERTESGYIVIYI